MKAIQTVKLSKKEQALFDAISWKSDRLARTDHTAELESLEKMGQLTESLLKRDAVPHVRLKWFADPEMNSAGRNSSIKQVFEKNGTKGKAIYRHPHFEKVLWYFIHGPKLPSDTIEAFCSIIEDDAGTSGMVLNQVKAFVRKEVRDKGLDRKSAADEFYKLAHEIDEPQWAELARSAAMSVRK